MSSDTDSGAELGPGDDSSLYDDAGIDTDASGHGDPLVEVDDLKTYYEGGGLLGGKPVKAVDGVSFDIHRGETLGLVGESGCGKSTLGRTLVQLEDATGGEVRYDGTDITTLSGKDLKNWRRNVQMVFQDPDSSLNDRMTVGEIVREPLDVHEWNEPKDRRERVRELLEVVGLREEHYYRYPHQFSGGQRQRVGIARALALEPEFIVLDEPVSALDVSVQAKILNLLNDLQNEFGLTYLLIAHDLSVVELVCDRVAVMYLGNVMELGDADELFEDPQNPYTHSLLSAVPEPDPTIEKERVTLRGTPPSPRDPPSGCPFSTRCPFKIRPDAYRDMDDEVWEAIEVYRDVLRERVAAEGQRSAVDRLKQVVGIKEPLGDIHEVVDDVFGDVDLDVTVETGSGEGQTLRSFVRESAELIEDDQVEAAQSMLSEAFAAECETRSPEQHTVSESGRFSRCHRHESEFQSPTAYRREHLD